MVSIADIDDIMQIENIFNNIFYEDTIHGMPALMLDSKALNIFLYIKEEELILEAFEDATDAEWKTKLTNAEDEEDLADFLQEFSSFLSVLLDESSDNDSKRIYKELQNELIAKGYEPLV